jgi:hypothetical protein
LRTVRELAIEFGENGEVGRDEQLRTRRFGMSRARLRLHADETAGRRRVRELARAPSLPILQARLSAQAMAWRK